MSRGETLLPFKWGRGRGSDFAGSDARWVHILFSIIKASTANHGKRKLLSFLSSVFIWQLIKAIFFFLIIHFLWHGFDCLSVYPSTITPIKRHCSSHLCYAVLGCAGGSTGLLALGGRFFLFSVSTDFSFLMTFHRIDFLKRKILSRK